MKNTFGLYIDNLCIDEVVIDSEGDEDLQIGTAEFFFRVRMGHDKIMKEKGFEIIPMTENTDDLELERDVMIDKLLDRVDQWDKDDLIAHVRERYRDELCLMEIDMLTQEYEDAFGDIEKLSGKVKY